MSASGWYWLRFIVTSRILKRLSPLGWSGWATFLSSWYWPIAEQLAYRGDNVGPQAVWGYAPAQKPCGPGTLPTGMARPAGWQISREGEAPAEPGASAARQEPRPPDSLVRPSARGQETRPRLRHENCGDSLRENLL